MNFLEYYWDKVKPIDTMNVNKGKLINDLTKGHLVNTFKYGGWVTRFVYSFCILLVVAGAIISGLYLGITIADLLSVDHLQASINPLVLGFTGFGLALLKGVEASVNDKMQNTIKFKEHFGEGTRPC